MKGFSGSSVWCVLTVIIFLANFHKNSRVERESHIYQRARLRDDDREMKH